MAFRRLVPMASPCLVVKIPEWFPGAGFKRLSREWHDTLEELVTAPYKFVLDQMVTIICSFANMRSSSTFKGCWHCPRVVHLESVGRRYFVGR
jgi:hypothetical protein